VLPALAEHYCTITLGGPHLGFASILEQRAEVATAPWSMS
jgi:hypothetical protein